ncbi:MAG: hypothetical protein ACP5G4_05540 [bacterium]
MIPTILLFMILAVPAFAEIIPPMQSIREAIEVRWLPPEEPFRMGEILHFTVVATNIAEDTAICYALSAGEIKGDSIEPYAVVELIDKYVSDTLAPGESASYKFTKIDGTTWLYDPYKDVRSYAEPVGLPCFPPGKYTLTHMVKWSQRESITFEVVPQTDPLQQTLLDSLAEAAVAYFVGRPEDAVKNARFCYSTDPASPLTARALILARGVAWEKELDNEAMEMDSLFWLNFGSMDNRHNYMPNPGFFSQTAGVLSRCAENDRIANYLDWLADLHDDPSLREEIEKARERLIK